MTKAIAEKIEARMTVREIARVMGVSVDTVKRCIRRIMPGRMQERKTTYLSQEEVALISKELKNNNYVTSQLTEAAGASVKTTTTELELFANYKQATEQLMNFLNEKNKELETENRSLKEELGKEKAYRTIKAMEMLTGKHYRYSELKNYSKEHGYEIHRAFDQNYGEVNAYHIDVWNACYGIEA